MVKLGSIPSIPQKGGEDKLTCQVNPLHKLLQGFPITLRIKSKHLIMAYKALDLSSPYLLPDLMSYYISIFFCICKPYWLSYSPLWKHTRPQVSPGIFPLAIAFSCSFFPQSSSYWLLFVIQESIQTSYPQKIFTNHFIYSEISPSSIILFIFCTRFILI